MALFKVKIALYAEVRAEDRFEVQRNVDRALAALSTAAPTDDDVTFELWGAPIEGVAPLDDTGQ